MGAITGGGREFGTNVTWIPKQWPWLVCGGIAAAAGADVMDIPGFPIDLVGKDGWIIDTVPDPIDTRIPPYEAPPFDDMNVTFMGEPVSPPDREAMQEKIEESRLTEPIGDAPYTVVVVPPAVLNEVSWAIDAMNGGASGDEVRKNASPEARIYLDIIATNSQRGVNLIVTDREVSFGLQLFPGKFAGFFSSLRPH